MKSSRWCLVAIALLVCGAGFAGTNGNEVRLLTADGGSASVVLNCESTGVESESAFGSGFSIGTTPGWEPWDEPVYRQARQDSKTARPMQPAGETSQTCTAQYEAATYVEAFFRTDRRITGVWQLMATSAGNCPKPEYLVSDVNGCLYGSSGIVWEPLDCPGRGFSSGGQLPKNIEMQGNVTARTASTTNWRWVDPNRAGATAAPEKNPPLSSFVLANQGLRGALPTPVTEEKIVCWWVTWWQLYCETWEPAPLPGIAVDDISGGTIAIRLADGSSLCLNPSGSSGLCRGPLPEGRLHEISAKISVGRER